ncbi:hypothetical protein AVEN_37748-1 [Araneus ventricosus]|uniref:Secreted protein n=1 Tax=Araneus ventricosus TaxID=182803 RepID=A0A4Y2BU85_ARAVE|nr:hypothetical protein AVEN_37748-1 [Araneus ventricosus]
MLVFSLAFFSATVTFSERKAVDRTKASVFLPILMSFNHANDLRDSKRFHFSTLLVIVKPFTTDIDFWKGADRTDQKICILLALRLNTDVSNKRKRNKLLFS